MSYYPRKKPNDGYKANIGTNSQQLPQAGIRMEV